MGLLARILRNTVGRPRGVAPQRMSAIAPAAAAILIGAPVLLHRILLLSYRSSQLTYT